jgi:arylsulfatase A-like enzyme
VGKWHLGHGDPRYLPTRRGFDRQYGPFFAAHYQTHVVPGYGGLDWHRNDEALREPGYTTELLGDEAVRIIQEADPQRPLFLYVAFTAPHAPLVGQERDLVAVSGIGDPNRRTFAAVVRAMDRAIGRIWRALEESGLADHTLLVFSSDNGGRLLWGASNGSLRGGKQTPYEGGVRVPAFARWPGTLPAGAVVEEPLHVVDWYATLLRVADAPMDSSLPVDGLDIWGTLERSEPSPHAEIVIDLARNRGAIRRGDWKLVLNGAYMSPRWYKREIELFELRSDPGERVNLAAEQPRIVDELWDRLQLYRSQAVPPLPSQASRPLGFEPPEVLGEGPHPGGTWGLANYLKQLVRDWRGESF